MTLTYHSERIKEELNNGKTLNGAIELGYKRAWSAVFDGNITVVFVAIILMGAFGPTDSVFGTLLSLYSQYSAQAQQVLSIHLDILSL